MLIIPKNIAKITSNDNLHMHSSALSFWVVSKQMLPRDKYLVGILGTAFRLISLHQVKQENNRCVLM